MRKFENILFFAGAGLLGAVVAGILVTSVLAGVYVIMPLVMEQIAKREIDKIFASLPNGMQGAYQGVSYDYLQNTLKIDAMYLRQFNDGVPTTLTIQELVIDHPNDDLALQVKQQRGEPVALARAVSWRRAALNQPNLFSADLGPLILRGLAFDPTTFAVYRDVSNIAFALRQSLYIDRLMLSHSTHEVSLSKKGGARHLPRGSANPAADAIVSGKVLLGRLDIEQFSPTGIKREQIRDIGLNFSIKLAEETDRHAAVKLDQVVLASAVATPAEAGSELRFAMTIDLAEMVDQTFANPNTAEVIEAHRKMFSEDYDIFELPTLMAKIAPHIRRLNYRGLRQAEIGSHGFSIGQIEILDFGGFKTGDISMRNFYQQLPKSRSVEIGELAIGELDVSGVFRLLSKMMKPDGSLIIPSPELQPADFMDIYKFDTVALSNLIAAEDGQVLFAMDTLRLGDLAFGEAGIESAKFNMDGVSMPMEPVRHAIPSLGESSRDIEKISLGFSIDYNYDPDRSAVRLNPVRFSVDPLGSLAVSTEFIVPKNLAILDAEKLQAQILSDTKFRYLQIDYDNQSFFQRVVQQVAHQQGSKVSQLLKQWQLIVQSLEQQLPSVRSKRSMAAVRRFMSKPSSLRLQMRPVSAFSLADVQKIAATNPYAIADTYNLSLEAR